MSDNKWTDKGYEMYALDQQWTKLQSKDKWLGWNTDLIKQRESKSSINVDGSIMSLMSKKTGDTSTSHLSLFSSFQIQIYTYHF